MTTQTEALKLALEALELDSFYGTKKQEAIIAIKEALAQPEQEPVAYLCENAVGHKYFRWKKPSSTYKPVALYTTPPQRTWIGLMRGVRVEGDTVVISTKNNDAARELCGALIEEMNR